MIGTCTQVGCECRTRVCGWAYLVFLVVERAVDEAAALVAAPDERCLHLGQQGPVTRHVLRAELHAAQGAVQAPERGTQDNGG